MKYFSMFSGIGGFELGIQNAYRSTFGVEQEDTQGNQEQGLLTTQGEDTNTPNRRTSERPTDEFDQRPLCVGYSEIDKYAIKVYERHFNGDNRPDLRNGTEEIQNNSTNSTERKDRVTSGHKNYGDATTINAKELPDFDLLVGGFPCQAFSIAGKRAGFDDTRGTLFFDIARILKEKQPRHLVLENVKGLLSHDSGRTFTTIIGVLTDLGYLVEWQVLNSKDFGVPQNRERVYIVGHLGNECRGKVFPIIGNDKQTFESNRVIVSRKQRTETSLQNISSTLTSHYRGSPDGDGRPGIIQLNQPTHSNDRVYGTDGVSPTLNTMQGGNRQPFIAAQRGRENGQVLEPQLEDKSNTLTAVAKDNYVVDVPRIRRLTPIECERLQGFEDNWTALDQDGQPISDTQRYKMCGNAVTVNTVETVMKSLIQHFN